MLTAKKVERAKLPGRYQCGLIRGLYLPVTASGGRSWVLRYQLRGQERWMGLGSATEFSLSEARERARAARQLLADRIDPLAGKRAAEEAAKLAEARRLTLREAAQRYFDQHEGKWRPATHREQFLLTLKAYVFPVLGDMDVATIDTPDILRALEPHWTSKAVTADRVRNRVEQVIDWAIVRGHRPPGTNPARWKGHLDQVLPAAREVAPVVHHDLLDPDFFKRGPGRLRLGSWDNILSWDDIYGADAWRRPLPGREGRPADQKRNQSLLEGYRAKPQGMTTRAFVKKWFREQRGREATLEEVQTVERQIRRLLKK